MPLVLGCSRRHLRQHHRQHHQNATKTKGPEYSYQGATRARLFKELTPQVRGMLQVTRRNAYGTQELHGTRTRTSLPAAPGQYGGGGELEMLLLATGAQVDSLLGMQWMMRWNDYSVDPISNGNPVRAIAARGDLKPPVNGKRSAFGATDSKVGQVESRGILGCHCREKAKHAGGYSIHTSSLTTT